MGVNRHRPHIHILPEDDANRQLANGFELNLDLSQIQVLPVAGGWTHVRDEFLGVHAREMRRFPHRFFVLMIDSDKDEGRIASIRASIPEDVAGRVFILGVLSEPEDLKRQGLGSFEAIGRTLAEDFKQGVQGLWAHDLMKHNTAELSLLRRVYCVA
ncbi:hypothetical protein [uncultured Rhodospira sp.]|uniref:hypothetical protein n=1 Tax=uncultured Rhodospira sp. TaxID=1936189 RepID=UPI00260500B8|nr:hypothetical protein [uncultured Rhodospira sp.]